MYSPRSSNRTPAEVLATHCLRKQDLARFGGHADPRRDVDRASVDVVAVADHIAGVEAEVQIQFHRLAQSTTLKRAGDGVAARREDRQDAIAHELAVNACPAVPADVGPQ